MTTIKCATCGKEYEPDPKWANWLAKNPDRAQCNDCRQAAFEKKNDKTKASTNSVSNSNSYSKKVEPKIEAKHIRKCYDMVMAEFADDYENVKDFIGGWTTTLLLNIKNRNELDKL